MKTVIYGNRNLKVFTLLVVLFFFLGCVKESPCKSIEQGDFILVE